MRNCFGRCQEIFPHARNGSWSGRHWDRPYRSRDRSRTCLIQSYTPWSRLWGRSVVVMQSPLMSRNAYDNNPGWQGPRIDPEPMIRPVIVAYSPPRTNSDASSVPPDAQEAADVRSDVSTHARNDDEDIVSVQFSSIYSPFLDTSHVHNAARPATSARRPTSLSMASSTLKPDGPLDGVDQPFWDPISLPEKAAPGDPHDFFAHLAIGPPEHPDCLRTGRSANPPRDTVYPPGPAHCNTCDGPVPALLLTFTTPPSAMPHLVLHSSATEPLKSCSFPFEARRC